MLLAELSGLNKITHGNTYNVWPREGTQEMTLLLLLLLLLLLNTTTIITVTVIIEGIQSPSSLLAPYL